MFLTLWGHAASHISQDPTMWLKLHWRCRESPTVEVQPASSSLAHDQIHVLSGIVEIKWSDALHIFETSENDTFWRILKWQKVFEKEIFRTVIDYNKGPHASILSSDSRHQEFPQLRSPMFHGFNPLSLTAPHVPSLPSKELLLPHIPLCCYRYVCPSSSVATVF